MQFSFPPLFVMVYVAVHFFEVVGGQRENCQKPKGIEGESRTEGCLKNTCKNGVWMASLEETVCCYEREAVTPNTNIISTTTQNGCTTTSLDCTLDGDQAKMVLSVKNNCPKPANENQIEELTQMLEQHRVTDHCSCESKTGTTTNTNYNYNGILVTGGNAGRGYSSGIVTTEVFIPETGKTCSLPNANLPEHRTNHTMDTLGNTPVVCGGTLDPLDLTMHPWTLTSCLHFTPTSASGVWSNYSTALESREVHSSWVSSAGLVLMGGLYSGSTTKIVGHAGGGNFSLEAATWDACAIADKDSVIMTGGVNNTWLVYNYEPLKVVARYNLQGHVENLPEMTQGRRNHGCGSYYDSNGSMVLVVAGGRGDGFGYGYTYMDRDILSSTEKLSKGAAAWTTSAMLPRKLMYVPTVSMNNRLYIIGGSDWKRHWTEILEFDGEDWTEVGQLQKGRAGHAATKIYTSAMVLVCN